MPHSSGGGSSHGSSHSSSSGSHSSRPQRPPVHRHHTRFPHCYSYVYYRPDGPHYVYTDRDINESYDTIGKKGKFILYTITILCFIGALVLGLFSYRYPSKLHSLDTSRIDDTLEVIENEDELLKTIQIFEEKTGIPVIIKTISSEDLKDYELIDYAYDYYVYECKDESEWVIVYTEYSDGQYFEGMQGDNTDNILNSIITEDFNRNLTYNLTFGNGFEYGIINSFEKITPNIMDKKINEDLSSMCIMFIVMGIFMFIITISSIKQSNKIEKERGYKDEELFRFKEDDLMKICPHCGKEFFNTNFKKCPYCDKEL